MDRCVHYLREGVGVVLKSQFFLILKLNWNFHRGRSGEVLKKEKKKETSLKESTNMFWKNTLILKVKSF